MGEIQTVLLRNYYYFSSTRLLLYEDSVNCAALAITFLSNWPFLIWHFINWGARGRKKSQNIV